MTRTLPFPRPWFLLFTVALVASASAAPALTEGVWEPLQSALLQGRTLNDTVAFQDTFATAGLWATDQGVVLVSDQGNGTWNVENRSTGLPPGAVRDLAPSPDHDPNTFYAATSSGIYRTTDRGMTWAPANMGFDEIPNPTSFANAGNYLFVNDWASFSIYRTDGVSSIWTQMAALPEGPHGAPFIGSIGEGLDLLGNPLVFAGTSGGGLFKTPDFGGIWQPAGLLDTDAGYVDTFGGDPLSPGTWYAGNGDADNSSSLSYQNWVFVTRDGGASWTEPFAPSSMTKSITDIRTWEPAAQMRSIPAGPSPAFLATAGGTVWQSLDGGGTWTDISAGLPSRAGIQALGQLGDYLLAGIQGGGIFRLAVAACAVTCAPNAQPSSGIAPLSVSFAPGISATGCDGGPWAEWTFGDGTSSVELFPTHIYARPGTYNWSLTATVDGKTCSGGGTVTVGSSVGTVMGAVVVGTAATAYLLSGLEFSAVAELSGPGGVTLTDTVDTEGSFGFEALSPGNYEVRVKLTYRDHIPYDAGSGTMGCPHPSGDGITKMVTSLPVAFQVAPGVNAVEVRFPPPLVLVHGIPGCYEKWYSDDAADPDYAALWDIAAREAGVISFTPNYSWSGACTSWNRAASQLADQVLEDLIGLHDAARGPSLPPVVLAAYDFGALVTRALCSGPYADHPATGAIQGIFLLAAPNSGADALFGGDAGVLSSPNFVVRRFNETYPNFGTKTSVVYAVGGNRGWWGLGDGDGRVSLYSAFHIARTSCNDITPHLSLCRPYTSVSFPSGAGHIFPYSHGEVGSPPSTQAILEGTILPILQGGLVLGTPESPAGGLIWGTGARTTGSAQGSVQSRARTEALEYPFTCSATDGLGVVAYATSGSATFEVLGPDGRPVAQREPESGQDAGFQFGQLNPDPGTWNLRVTPGPEGVSFQAVMLENSLFGISAYTDKTAYGEGETAILRVDEDISQAPETQFTEVVASICQPGGTPCIDVPLLDNGENHDGDDGDGQWGASVTVPSAPGLYPVIYKARGTYGGTPFVRTAREALSVVPASHLFTGTFSDAPFDLDGNGRYDTIRFTAQLDLPAGCGAVVTGDLTDAEGEFIGHATAFVEPSVRGPVDARLWFRLERLFCTQLLLALRVTNLTVLDGLTLAPMDAWGDPVPTANYDSSSFDCRTGTVTPTLGAVRPDQATQGQALDVVVSGRGFRVGATLDFGAGIVPRRMIYLGPTAIAASVTVLEDASPGPRAVTVTNPGNASDTAQGAFEVVAPTSPTAVLQTPSPGQTVRGALLASAEATDSVRVAQVELLMDGSPVGSDATFPFQFTWDSRSVPNGPHSLAARATNAAGLSRTSAAAEVTVDNPTTPGDCDGSGTVSIGEVQKAINMFLGIVPPDCGVDCSGDGTVSIGEVQKVINGFLGVPASC